MSAKNKTYAVFNFDNFSEAGLKQFANSLANKDCAVASITATNRATKRDGLPTKRAALFFHNQQKAEIIIGGSGDIISLKINSKPTPTGDPKNLYDFVKHISSLLKTGQASFDKALKRRLSKIKVDKPQTKPASRSNKARIEEAEALLKEAQAELATQRIASNEQLELVNSKKEMKTQLEADLNAEKAINKELKAQLKVLNK